MATRIITLRPSSDVSLEHSCSSGSSGYLMIDDVTSDEDSTYIYSSHTNSSSSKTSLFSLSGSIPNENINITGATLHVSASSSNSMSTAQCNCYFSVGDYNGTNNSSMGIETNVTTSYQDFSSTSTAFVDAINAYIKENNSFPNIYVKIITTGKTSSSKNTYQVRTTQVYVDLNYETVDSSQQEFYIKQNGSWIVVSAVYRKENGVWVEQTDISSLFDSDTKYVKG